MPLLLAAFFTATPQSHASLTLDEVIERVDTTQKQLDSLDCRFDQSIRTPAGETLVRMSGHLWFRRPNALRIDQAKPQKQTVLRNGDTVRVYTPAANQILTGSWAGWVKQGQVPAPLTTFLGDLPASEWRQHYNVLFGGLDQGAYRVQLTSKENPAVKLELWLSEKSGLMSRGRLKDGSRVIDVKVSDIRQNIAIAGSRFELKAAPGTVTIPLEP